MLLAGVKPQQLGTDNAAFHYSDLFLNFQYFSFRMLHKGFLQLPPYVCSELGLTEEKVDFDSPQPFISPNSSKAYAPGLQHQYTHSHTEPGRVARLTLLTE